MNALLNCTRYEHMHLFFFFNDTATTEIYTLSLHDALPIFTAMEKKAKKIAALMQGHHFAVQRRIHHSCVGDRKSTRLNSSHSQISYAVFCLKKKNELSV